MLLPFAADDARHRHTFLVHVHFGQSLQALLPLNSPPPNTFVVATVGEFARSRAVECHAVAMSEWLEPYERQYSPFAATRIVDKSFAPCWNELLVLPEPSGTTTTPSNDGDATCALSPTLALKLEVIVRDQSQQEDSLLASMIIPLSQMVQQPSPLAIRLLSTSEADGAPTIFISISHSPVVANAPLDRLELLVQSFVPSKEMDESKTDEDSEQFTVVISFGSPTHPPAPEALSKLISAFRAVGHGEENSLNTIGPRVVGVTPSCQWRRDGSSLWFPLILAIDATSIEDLYLWFFHNSKLVGHGSLPQLEVAGLLSANLQTGAKSAPVAIRILSDTQEPAAHDGLASWQEFISSRLERRVVCTNRRNFKRPRQPEWMGAIIRGLNRCPIASLCDEGGVSGVVVGLFAEEKQATDAATVGLAPLVTEPTNPTPAVLELLQAQVQTLQRDATMKNKLIERLQNDVDARSNAIKMCGQDLVALRRELRQKDEQIDQLTARVREFEQRESQLMAELLEPGGAVGLRTDSAASHRLSLLLIKYKELERKHDAAVRKAEGSAEAVREKELLQGRYNELEQAHMEQATQLQRLQREKQLLKGLKQTIQLQEQVIGKFESTVGTRTASNQALSAPATVVPPAVVSFVTQRDRVEGSDEQLAVRVRVLEDQLKRNAMQAAGEISALKMRILELEAQSNPHF
ncbi:TPA: hypothetical protein N0F65_011573 [Lagenidium giganteum]|uniref:C2 domain-containing protein n=1 Tax=Lagenidium giganteum TaxID=4803 RepID=A0AAV2YJH4_9STRA|nr:TPA: hypothetical protein N0F65_011573 [Lagenidium giganteum]